MPHDKRIWVELMRRVVNLYCPELSKVKNITKEMCGKILMLAICDRWNIDYDTLPGDQTFHKVLLGDRCGEAMKERLALFYYAFIDAAVAADMRYLYLQLEGKERIEPRPLWNRFIEEYKSEREKPHAALLVRPKCWETTLRTLPPAELDEIKQALKNIEAEELVEAEA